MLDQLQTIVLCLRSGGDFSFQDVQLLTKHLHSKSGVSLKVLCLSDRVSNPFNLNGMTLVPMQYHWKGWWAKMNIFSPEMEQYRPFLYIDLDSAVVNDLSGILPPVGNENKFITLGSFSSDRIERELQSGMMWIPANSKKVSGIWNSWIRNPEDNMRKNRGDQEFLKKLLINPDEWWQKITDKICSFKINKSGTWLNDIPEEISVICFHGKPRIPEASHSVKWVNEYIQV